ncbi:Yip1 family protein [Muriicola sp.]|uniref:Yip1 family protein n=1 Tax=Muriicola sp. TaxID=2020856 RepID=UPI003C72C404
MQVEISNSEDSKTLTDKEIFTKIWLSPRKVFKFINDQQYDRYVYLLLALAGIANAFDRAVSRDLGDKMSLWGIIMLCFFVGGFLGWISIYIYAGLISWTGKWLKGEGNSSSILRILSYALIPIIVAMIFLVPQIGIYGKEMFKSDGDITSAGLIPNFIFYGTMILEFVLAIWTIVLCVVAVAEVQKFSIAKSILNLLLPVFLIGVPILIIILWIYSI